MTSARHFADAAEYTIAVVTKMPFQATGREVRCDDRLLFLLVSPVQDREQLLGTPRRGLSLKLGAEVVDDEQIGFHVGIKNVGHALAVVPTDGGSHAIEQPDRLGENHRLEIVVISN